MLIPDSCFLLLKCIPKNEPVVMCGDLNVNRYAEDKPYNSSCKRTKDSWRGNANPEYTALLETLRAKDLSKYNYVVNECLRFSADPDNNTHAQPGPSSDGEYELLDYILINEVSQYALRARE